MTSSNPRDPGSSRRVLERGRPAVRYDVEAGLQRHRELLQQGAPPPEWAKSLGSTRRFSQAWLLSALAGLALLGLLAARLVAPAGEPAPTLATLPSAREVPSGAGSRPVPTVTPLSEPKPAAPATDPSAGPGTPAAPEAQSDRAPGARPTPLVTGVDTRSPLLARAPEGALQRPPPARAGHAGRAAGLATAEPARAGSLPQASAVRAPLDTPPAQPGDQLVAELAAGGAMAEPSAPEPPPAEPAVRTPAPEAIDPEVLEEMQQLASAERLLRTMPSRTLSMVREGMQRFPHGYLAQERRYLEIMALLALRMPKDAELLSRGFFRDYPNGPYRRKIERALEEGARD